MIQPCSPAVTYSEHPGVRLVIEEDNKRIRLLLLQVATSYRGQGLARRILEELCGYADIRGLLITLWAADPLVWEQDDLVRFYGTLGFRVAGPLTWDECVPMVRKPQISSSIR